MFGHKKKVQGVSLDLKTMMRQQQPRKCRDCGEVQQVCFSCGSYWCSYCRSFCTGCQEQESSSTR